MGSLDLIRATLSAVGGLWCRHPSVRLREYLLNISAMVVIQLALNAWNEPFYCAIQRKDLDTFSFSSLPLVSHSLCSILIPLNNPALPRQASAIRSMITPM